MQSVQIAASEIWITLIFCVVLYLFKNELNQKRATKTLMLVCIIRLLSDAVSWSFDGLPGLFWGTVTRISNYVTFVSNDAISLVFSIFIWHLVRRANEKPGLILKGYWLLEVITMAALTLNLYFGWFYAFDSDNLYSRGAYYRFTHIAPMVAIFVILWLLIRYHGRFSKNMRFLCWVYFTLMAGATAYELAAFGLSLQTYAQSFSALVAFFIGEIEIRENLVVMQQTLEQKNKELKNEESKVEAALQAEKRNTEIIKKQQQQVSLALKTAQQANKAKTMFLNSMSHDIRTPMNAILGFAALARTHIDNKEQVQDYLAKINTSSAHLLSLINDILDMSRIESGSVKLEEKAVHMPALLQDLQTMVHGLINAKQQHFEVDAKGVQHEDVITDKLRLNQVLINIVGNAVKFTPEGGNISIHIAEKPSKLSEHTNYEFIIKDTGMGMSPEFLEHVFETFARERSATVSGIQGTGLGMAITKNIVDMMGGSIDVKSELGKGSQFTVTLPFRIASPCEQCEQPDDNHSEHKEGRPDYTGIRALLVEDNELNREIASMILGETGMQIDCAEDGIEAVNIINEAPEDKYDLVLMDIQMPRMDGYTATREIRTLRNNRKANIPIVAMTANAFEEDRKKAFECGMNGHIVKPIDIKTIAKVIDQVLEKRR